MTVTAWRALAAALFVTFGFPLSAQEYKRTTDFTRSAPWYKFGKNLSVPEVEEVNFGNSPRLELLLRDGKLYLSLRDAIALAVENNLDIANARYTPMLADADVLRAAAGSQLRGTQTQIGTLSTGLSAQAVGPAGAGQVTGVTGRAGGGGPGGGGNTGAIGDVSSFFGSTLTPLDPTISGSIQWGHFSNPQISNFITGTNTFITESTNSRVSFSKGFLTGTVVTLNWNVDDSATNNLRANFNPSINSSLTLQIRQPLLRGFGVAVNSREIKVAKNNQEVSDLTFKLQVIQTVAQIQSLYWDLVSFMADVEGRQEDLRLAEKTYADNKRRVEIGTLAPIEIVRAEAEVAGRQQDLTLAVTRVRQQETVLKNALSKNGLLSPSLLDAEIVPTDQIEVPEEERMEPLRDLFQTAEGSRPELMQSRLQLDNQDLRLRGVKNALRPSVDVIGDLTNNGLAGQINERFIPFPGVDPTISEFFLGGLGTALGQNFRRNFPDYSIRLQVSVPIKNRQAQADIAATLIERRRADINLRQQENNIRVEVQNAVIGVEQARARLDAAVKTRVLQEKTLDAEQKKFNLGASTLFLVVQAQRDLALARASETAARGDYIKARVEIERATGQTLAANGIILDEAYRGRVSRPADAIPTSVN